MRWLWFCCGWLAVAVGGVGVVVPGLPTTVFFIIAAWCFARSSPRFEKWVLDLPRVGRMVSDHRAGLGMPRRAKILSISMIVGFGSVSVYVSRHHLWVAFGISCAVIAGILYVGLRVPTRERVLGDRMKPNGGR